MLFGNPHRLAIEVELHSNSGGVWMNGKSCYWIADECIGDLNVIDSLRDTLFCWERISYDRDRSNEDLFHLNTKSLVTALNCGLYNYDCEDQEWYHRKAVAETWARHNINPGTPAFDEWNIYLVEMGAEARCAFVRSDSPPSSGREQRLRAGEFAEILSGAIAYLLKIYNQLIA